MRRLFLDLDGVMADFDGHFMPTFGVDHRTLPDNEMWALIDGHGSYFRSLPPCPDALHYFHNVLKHYVTAVLTACPRSDYENVAAQKKAWVREHLGDDILVLPTCGGSSKPIFLQHPGDILIDDFEKNTAAWEKAGGRAVLHTGDWNATHEALVKAMFSA